MTFPSLEEPLIESAPLARQFARRYCVKDPATTVDCVWYHSFWQYMRVMKVAKTSGGHVAFLVEALRDLARSGRYARVLVSGSADYSMPAHVLSAYQQEGATADLHVLDRCETPVALTRWYTARLGMTITGYVYDILDFESARSFDVVMTNSFLGYFDPQKRGQLFARWARLLRPGGRLILTNRIRAGAGYEPVGFTADQARVFCETVRREAERRRDARNLDPDDMVRLAAAYAERFRSIPVRSDTEVVDLVRANGFSIERLDTAIVTGRTDGGAVSGPSTAERADYMRLVATRD
jgi:SAM-dependent methyltransferase